MDEDDILGRNKPTKLASIFAQEPDYSSAGSASLAYKGAKKAPGHSHQPSLSATAATPTAASAAASSSASASTNGALYAGLVSLIRYDAARVGTVVGQRALALMRHPTSGGILLLVYEPADSTKRDVILQVTEQFAFVPQQQTYGFFYDDQRNYWCVQMTSAEALQELCKSIGIGKASSSAALTTAVTQDLSVNAAESRGVAAGDAVKLRGTIYAFTSGAALIKGQFAAAALAQLGTEEKPKQLKLGAGKDIPGLEQGLIGMKKGGKRMIVVPAALGYGSAGNASLNVAPNQSLVLEVELLKVKFKDEAAAKPPSTPTASSVAPAVPNVTVSIPSPITEAPTPVAVPVPGSVTVEDETPNKPSSRRPSLVSRMAAMGAFIMPGVSMQQPTPVVHAAPGGASTATVHETADETTSTPTIVQQQQQQPQQHHVVPPTPTHQPILTPASSQHQNYQPGGVQHDGMNNPFHSPQPQQPHQNQMYNSHQQQQQPHFQNQQQMAYNSLYPQQQQQQQNPMYGGPNQPSQQQQQQQHGFPSFNNQYGNNNPNAGLYGSTNPQQQLGPGGFPGSSPTVYTLDTKLDAIHGALTRCLGTGSSYDPNPTLTGQQLIKGLTQLVTERDENRTRADKASEQVTELQNKITHLHERNETYLSENTRLAELRFQSFAEEVRNKNAVVNDLQESLRNAQSEISTQKETMLESELRITKLTTQLESAQAEVKDRAELIKTLARTQIQLDEARKSHEQTLDESKASLLKELETARIEAAEAKQQVEEKTKEKETEVQAKQTEIDEARDALTRAQARIAELELTNAALAKSKDTLTSSIDSAGSTLAQRESELAQAKLQHEHAANEASVKLQELTEKNDALTTELDATKEEVSQLKTRLTEAESSGDEKYTALLVAHEALQASSRDSSASYQTKLEDVVSKARLKIEHLTAELETALTEKLAIENAKAEAVQQAETEKQEVIDQSKQVIAKIRVQVQEQQKRHEEELEAAVAAATAAATAAADSKSSENAVSADGLDWRVQVKRALQQLFQLITASLSEIEEEGITKGQLRELVKEDMKRVIARFVNGEEEEEEATEAEAEASEEAAESQEQPESTAEASPEPVAAEEETKPASESEEGEITDVKTATEEKDNEAVAEAASPVDEVKEEAMSEPVVESASEPLVESAVPTHTPESTQIIDHHVPIASTTASSEADDFGSSASDEDGYHQAAAAQPAVHVAEPVDEKKEAAEWLVVEPSSISEPQTPASSPLTNTGSAAVIVDAPVVESLPSSAAPSVTSSPSESTPLVEEVAVSTLITEPTSLVVETPRAEVHTPAAAPEVPAAAVVESVADAAPVETPAAAATPAAATSSKAAKKNNKKKNKKSKAKAAAAAADDEEEEGAAPEASPSPAVASTPIATEPEKELEPEPVPEVASAASSSVKPVESVAEPEPTPVAAAAEVEPVAHAEAVAASSSEEIKPPQPEMVETPAAVVEPEVAEPQISHQVEGQPGQSSPVVEETPSKSEVQEQPIVPAEVEPTPAPSVHPIEPVEESKPVVTEPVVVPTPAASAPAPTSSASAPVSAPASAKKSLFDDDSDITPFPTASHAAKQSAASLFGDDPFGEADAFPAAAPAKITSPASTHVSSHSSSSSVSSPPPAASVSTASVSASSSASTPKPAVTTPAAAPAPKKASSLFGDDDDDDLFPAPTATAKLKATPKKSGSLFDDDD